MSPFYSGHVDTDPLCPVIYRRIGENGCAEIEVEMSSLNLHGQASEKGGYWWMAVNASATIVQGEILILLPNSGPSEVVTAVI